MTFRHLKIFVTVADCGKMSLAAQQLYISQPAVSQAIMEIEDEYNVKLFNRLSQKIYLTDSGNRLLDYARHIISSYEEMEIDMKNSGVAVNIRVGASVSVGTCLLNPIITRLEQENSNIYTTVFINNTSSIESMILHSTLDIAIVEGEIYSSDIVQIPVYQDELVLVTGTSHPFAKLKEISLEQLAHQSMIVREDGSRARNQFERLLIDNNIDVNVKWNSSNTEAIKNALKANQGFAVLSNMLIQDELKNHCLVSIPIKGINLTRDINLIYHKNKFISEHLKHFIDMTSNYSQESPGTI